MKYLLSEQEYKELTSTRRKRLDVLDNELQEFCTKAAMHIPIVRDWPGCDKTPKPWGCILGPREQHPIYCDDCPCIKICPYDGKEWSK